MLKWYEEMDGSHPGIVSSRVRLARNWNQYVFPSKLSPKEGAEMIRRLESGLRDLGSLDGKIYHYVDLGEISEIDRKAMREHRLFNSAIAGKRTPTGIILSEEEDTGILLNGTDHIRLQVLAGGFHLEELWKHADKIDDYISERFEYAFDEKYGYLTAYPTNVGTGMRASVVLHLPTLSRGKRFNGLVAEMGRFGVAVKGVYGEGEENDGALYEVYNQKTLGLSEQDLLNMVRRVALQLESQEIQVRHMALDKHRLKWEDEAYRTYGVLKYARRLSAKDAMTLLSQLMTGMRDGTLNMQEPCPVYRLMLGIQPATLQGLVRKPIEKEELDVARAAYLRSQLPDLV